MEFTLDRNVMLSHLVLDNKETGTAISRTPLWTEKGVLEAKLTINGIQVPAEDLENLLQRMWTLANKESEKKELNRILNEKAKKYIESRFSGALEQLHEIENKLELVKDDLSLSWEED